MAGEVIKLGVILGVGGGLLWILAKSVQGANATGGRYIPGDMLFPLDEDPLRDYFPDFLFERVDTKIVVPSRDCFT